MPVNATGWPLACWMYLQLCGFCSAAQGPPHAWPSPAPAAGPACTAATAAIRCCMSPVAPLHALRPMGGALTPWAARAPCILPPWRVRGEPRKGRGPSPALAPLHGLPCCSTPEPGDRVRHRGEAPATCGRRCMPGRQRRAAPGVTLRQAGQDCAWGRDEARDVTLVVPASDAWRTPTPEPQKCAGCGRTRPPATTWRPLQT